jgi:3-hydroxymyristoyl/3-hydroxydecanoyl-(acyl carrier protein) dehydratase
VTPEAVAGGWRVLVAPDWPGFAGHFPGDPVLPAAELLEQALHCAADAGHRATGIRKARFLHPVRPGDELHWTLVQGRDAPGLRASLGEHLVCELWLTP